jgi:hypothetical protein
MASLSFTHKYGCIDTFTIKDRHLTIYFHDSPRWICNIRKDSISSKGDCDIVLYDNYGEIYRMKFLNQQLTSETNNLQVRQEFISLEPRETTLYQLPDIAINVLKSMDHPVGLETLRRLAEQIHKPRQPV